MRRALRAPRALSLALVLALGFAAGCQDDEPAIDEGGPDVEQTTTPDVEDVADEEVFENPDEFVGRTVTLSGSVVRILNPRAFLLEGDAAVGEDLLVLSTTDLQVGPDQEVEVTGTVGEFVLEDVEREVGDLDDNLFLEYQDDRYLLATSVTPAGG